MQVCPPKALPQRAFVDTFWLEDGAAGDTGVGVAEGAGFDRLGELEHVPNAELQPTPQYALDRPQYPYWLQEFPKIEPEHVWPWVPPHFPS
jgi:hypothetical protein